MIKLWRLRKAFEVALDYLKTPYCFLTPTNYSEHAHDHICFALRLMGSSYKDVCPYHNCSDFDRPELSDCCDTCPYFGIIDFRADEAGERSIYFWMHKPIVETFEEYKHGN